MNTQDIRNAIDDAQRFIDAANEALNEQEHQMHVMTYIGDGKKELRHPYHHYIKNGWLHGGKLAANVKRKSMDLTRSLSKMRQG